MAGFSIVFEALPGTAELQAEIKATMAAMKDFTPIWPEIREAYAAHESEVFASEGPGWAELAQSTIDRKSALGLGGALIEERTGALAESFTTDAMGFYPTTMSVTMGSILDYAVYQQTGSESHPNQPPRDLVHIEPEDAMLFWKILFDYVFGKTSISAMGA